MNAVRALEKLTRWSTVFVGWQLGNRPGGDPEYDAVRDHRELTLILRAELDAVTNLLIAKGVFTFQEWDDAVVQAATHLENTLESQFPGFSSVAEGIQMNYQGARAAKRWQRRQQ